MKDQAVFASGSDNVTGVDVDAVMIRRSSGAADEFRPDPWEKRNPDAVFTSPLLAFHPITHIILVFPGVYWHMHDRNHIIANGAESPMAL